MSQNALAPLQCSPDCTAATDTATAILAQNLHFAPSLKPTYTPDHTQLKQLIHEIKDWPNILRISTTLPLMSAFISPAYLCVHYWLGWFRKVFKENLDISQVGLSTGCMPS